MSRAISLTLAAALALAGAAGAAQAQPGPGPRPQMPAQGGPMMGFRERNPQDMAQHLRALLQLRPNQEPALNAYVQALPSRGTMMFRLDDRDAPQTTPERLAAMEKMITEHMAAMRTAIEATRRFYDQLDPAQKRAFDELYRGGLMGMGPMGMGPMTGLHMMGVGPAAGPPPPAPPPS